MDDKIIIKRKKRKAIDAQRYENTLEWIDFFRKNPHRTITDYLGLPLHDFQNILVYDLDQRNASIDISTRGGAKSTVALLFAFHRCIMYPNTQVVIVAPTKEQANRFISKAREFIQQSSTLNSEIENIYTSINNTRVNFYNSSNIWSVPYGESALGVRANVLIVDEFVRTDKAIITRVFVPFLTSPRKPLYTELTEAEKRKLPVEENKQIYLSSIRGADEWSYKEFEKYLSHMSKSDMRYGLNIFPYEFGIKNGFISKTIVEQTFQNNEENREMLLAEFCCIPERSAANSYFKYGALAKCQDNVKALYAMSDEEYITYKYDRKKWKFYQEKLPNEIRLLTIDIALIESAANDNTAIWCIRLIPDGGKYKKIAAYCESIHGINAVVQAKRFKQLFYELECDYAAIDIQGSGAGVYDILTTETYDEVRNVTYPAWTVVNVDDFKLVNRTLSRNAVPVIYGVRTPPEVLYTMITNTKNIIDANGVSLLMDTDDGISYLNERYKFYEIEDSETRARLLNSYVQTRVFINEAINLKQYVQGGYIKLKEKSGRRKDRVMSFIYGLWYAKILEDQLQKPDMSFLDFVQFV